MRKRPSSKFKRVLKTKIQDKIVSYRLPVKLIDDLKKFVDEENSACEIVKDALTWAITDMKAKRS